MRVVDTPLPGCKLIEASPIRDERGYFARMFDVDVFREHGLNTALAQSSLSFNEAAGTLRGLHYQALPRMEDKLVRCARGAVFDVAVDIRPDSPTFGTWFSCELTEENLRQLYIPAGFAHGFQTLADGSIVAYHISVPHEAALTAGFRYDDADVAVAWPLAPSRLSKRDRELPPFSDLDRATLACIASLP